MNVREIAITSSLIGDMTPEELIVYIARVSNPDNQWNTETSDRLIHYCMRKKHWSIFEQVDLTVEVQTSRAISAQIIRHFSIRPQEFSQRYAIVAELEPIEFRKQAETNRQSSTELFEDQDYINRVDQYLDLGLSLYTEGISKGVAKESARFILPMTSSTKLYLKGSVRSWIHYMMVRREKETQKEHRLVAEEIYKIFSKHFPIITKAFNKFEANTVKDDTVYAVFKIKNKAGVLVGISANPDVSEEFTITPFTLGEI